MKLLIQEIHFHLFQESIEMDTGNGEKCDKWAMGTEWITGLITISPYWMDTQWQANEFISLYHYRKSPDIKKVWYQQEGYETNRYTYSPTKDAQTEQTRRRLAQELRDQRRTKCLN